MNNYSLASAIIKGIGFIIIVALVNVQNLWIASSLIQKVIDLIKA